jgi:hypothetical protein
MPDRTFGIPTGYLGDRTYYKVDVPDERIAVLIVGRSGAGKTEVGLRVKRHLHNADLFPMAQGVKEIARAMGWDGDKDDAGRRLLQDIGSVGRAYNEDMWVARQLARHLSASAESENKIVFIADDVRYGNEIVRVRDVFKYVFVIRVNRKNGGELSEEAAAHVSEQEWPTFQADYVINNDGSKKDLDRWVPLMLRQLVATMS